MQQALFGLSLLTLLVFLQLLVELVLARKHLGFLKNIPPLEDSQKHSVSVIIPARNEQRNIEKALQSILHLDYENIEIIIVDDRSTDNTGAIIEKMHNANPHIKPLHIKELPKGWIGKNYALYTGAQSATGEFLLFTDADVVMEPTVLKRAINYMQQKKFDHLALGPDAKMPGVLLNIFMTSFAIFFGLYAKPWKVSNPKSKCHIGIGAFNLIRHDVYKKIGTHQAIAMRPDDDLKLGKLVKIHGFQQGFLFGKDLISVEWYSTFGELLKGLEKNSFAGAEYSVTLIVASAFLQIFFFVWPFLGIFLTSGWTQIDNILIVAIIFTICFRSAASHNIKKIYILTFPVGVLMFMFILWRSTIITLIRDGIDWRDTHYSLKELKANKI